MKTSQKITVGLLFGGVSGEHEVSLTSASGVLKSIDRDRFEVVPILITRQGEWLWVEDPGFMLNAHDGLIQEKDYPQQGLISVVLDYTRPGKLIVVTKDKNGRVRPSRFLPVKLDVIFPILHGPYGEDGTVQGLCVMAKLPCVGAGILGSAAGLDKVTMKALFAHAGLPVVPYLTFLLAEWQQREKELTQQIEDTLGYPVFIKPANGGSSVGVTKAKQRQQLKEAIELAGRFDRKIVAEKGLQVREVECAILGNDFPQASVVGEVVYEKEFYDYEAKYAAAATRVIIPAQLPQEVSETVRQLALRGFAAVDCAGFARVDFFIDKTTQKVYINEINTIPGFTTRSMFPSLWGACGISYPELITKLIELAIARFQEMAQKICKPA